MTIIQEDIPVIFQTFYNGGHSSRCTYSEIYNCSDIGELLLYIRYNFPGRQLRLMDNNTMWEWAEKYNGIEHVKKYFKQRNYSAEFIIGFETHQKNDDLYTHILNINPYTDDDLVII